MLSRERNVQAPRPQEQRTLEAASLLREALALLAGAPPESSLHLRLPDRLLRLPEVQQITGLRRSTIYEQMQRGSFPHSVKMGPRSAAWSQSAVQQWVAERLDSR